MMVYYKSISTKIETNGGINTMGKIIVNTVDELKAVLKPMYIIDDYMETESKYDKLQNDLYDIILSCYWKKACRTYQVAFKFYRDSPVRTMEFRHFIINLFVWYAYVELYGRKGVLSDDIILDPKKDLTYRGLINYINDKIIIPLSNYGVNYKRIQRYLAITLHNLSRISTDNSVLLGLTMNLHTFTDLYKNNKEYYELAHTVYPLDMEPRMIEITQNELIEKEVEIFKAQPNNVVGVALRVGTCIKPKQLGEFTINGALKPDLSGKTIPLPMNSNTMMGMNQPSTLYIEAAGVKKSLVANKLKMGTVGHFSKSVNEIASTLSLSKTVTDCHTKHFIHEYIRNKKMLSKYNGRYYRLNKDESFRILDARKDTHLIGKIITLRSPMTCALENTVCHRCYGALTNINYDIANGIAAYGSEETTRDVNQNVLSTKHLLTTISEDILFNDVFYKYFTFVGGEICLSEEFVNNPDSNVNDYEIVYDHSDISYIDEMDSEEGLNSYLSTGQFAVRNRVTKEKETISVSSSNSSSKMLYFTDEAVSIAKTYKGVIPLKELDSETAIFVMDIDNDELTKPLYDFMEFLNKKRDDDVTIDELSDKMVSLLIESNIPAAAIEGELILNRLIRDADDMYHRPDFTQKEMPKFKYVTVNWALENNASPLVGMSFQNLERQMKRSSFTTERTEPSYIDVMYKQRLDTKPLFEGTEDFNTANILDIKDNKGGIIDFKELYDISKND